VDDLDEQVQLFDIRAGGFQTQPVVRFGHRMQANSPARHSPIHIGTPRDRSTIVISHEDSPMGTCLCGIFATPKWVHFMLFFLFGGDIGSLTPKLETQKVAVKLESRDVKRNVVHTAISGLDVASFSTGVVTIYKQVL
jgi:hypothetical protein